MLVLFLDRTEKKVSCYLLKAQNIPHTGVWKDIGGQYITSDQ